MDRAGREILPGAALAEEQDRRARYGRHAAHEGPHLLHLGVLPQDRPYRELLPPSLLERGPFLDQRAFRQSAREERGQLVDVHRLGEVLVGAGLERLDGGGDVGVAREDEDGHVAVGRPHAPRDLDAARPGHHQIGDHGVGRLLGEASQQRFRTVEGVDAEPPHRAQVGGQQPGVGQVVVENVDFRDHRFAIGPASPLILGNMPARGQDPCSTTSAP